METIGVLVVDNEELLREGISTLLNMESGVRVIGTAADGAEAVEACGSLSPDVVLMDIRMPGMDGIEATKKILEKHPQARILMLSTFAEDELIFAAINAGARGYLLKDASSAEVANAIRQVYEGKAALEPGIAMKLITAVKTAEGIGNGKYPEKKQPVIQLSRREQETLTLIAMGYSNKEIADQLFLAEGTVKNRVSDILQKIDVRDRTQAAIRARELNIM